MQWLCLSLVVVEIGEDGTRGRFLALYDWSRLGAEWILAKKLNSGRISLKSGHASHQGPSRASISISIQRLPAPPRPPPNNRLAMTLHIVLATVARMRGRPASLPRDAGEICYLVDLLHSRSTLKLDPSIYCHHIYLLVIYPHKNGNCAHDTAG